MAVVQSGIGAINGRLLTGWVSADLDHANIELLADGRLLGGTIAEPDDTNARLVFEYMLPRVLFDGAEHEIALRVEGQEVALVNARHRLGTPGPVIGWLEKIAEGNVFGWAWYPTQPETRVEVELLVDGHVAGAAIAGLYRADVANAGKGDGCYGFSWPLPYSVLAMARDVTISARDKRSGDALPEPVVFRQKSVADAMSKIASLENDVRLLNATIAALEKSGTADERATSELFKTVGDFFSDLACGAAPRRSVRAAADVIGTLAPVVLPACAAPEFSVVVEAGGELAATYAVLHEVAEALGAAKAEVFLADDGECDEAALLPSIVQHLRYARLPGPAVARCNDAMRLAAGGVVVFLAAGARPAGDWVRALKAFEQQPELAMIAAQRGLAAPEIFAASREAWKKLGGLDEGFTGLSAALAEFSLRARKAGLKFVEEPGFEAISAQRREENLDIAASRADAERLRNAIGEFEAEGQAND